MRTTTGVCAFLTSRTSPTMPAGDPYQLRIYTPDGFSGKRVELSDGLAATMKMSGNLLTVDYKAATGKDVEWKVYF